jgi:hypothetical protein
VQPDGKLVAAGASFTGGSYDFALARHNADGSNGRWPAIVSDRGEAGRGGREK